MSLLTFGFFGGAAQPPSAGPLVVKERHNKVTGLTEIYSPNVDVEVKLDIVFVHGLTGSLQTWLEPESQIYWPTDLLPQHVSNARIFAFEYDANVVNAWTPVGLNRVSGHSSNLCGSLAGRRERTNTQRRPLIFVAHSLSGLVVQKALLLSTGSPDAYLKSVVDSTLGVIFLGTPHKGSKLANWASLGTAFSSVAKATNRDIVKLLEPDSEVLADIRNSFVKLVRVKAKSNSEIEIVLFYEELGIRLVGKVVTQESATLDGYESFSIAANHVTMTKFSSPTDPGYAMIMEQISRLSNGTDRNVELDGVTPTAFKEEELPLLMTTQPKRPSDRDPLLQSFDRKLKMSPNPMNVWFSSTLVPSQEFLDAFPPSRQGRTGTNNASSFSTIDDDMKSLRNETQLAKPISRMENRIQKDSSTKDRKRSPPSSPRKLRELIAQWISPLNYQDQHESTSSELYEGTGVWISERTEFIHWRDSPESCLFWLYGAAGSGKTVLSSFVIDALANNPRTTVLYFYCSYRSPDRCSECPILLSLLRQLYSLTTCPDAMNDYYERRKFSSTPLTHTDAKIDLYKIFIEMLFTPKTYIIIDGLDECKKTDTIEILNAWREIRHKSRKTLKLFLSSRPSTTVELNEGTDTKLELTPNLTSSDLQLVLDKQLDHVRVDWAEWDNESSSRKYLKQSLVERAQGLFLHATLPVQGLQRLQRDPSLQTPQSINLIYDQVLRAITSQEPYMVALAERVFYILLYSIEPLRFADISVALGMNLNGHYEAKLRPLTYGKILMATGDLMQCIKDPNGTEFLRFVHRTVEDYLRQHLDESLGHTYMAKTCLAAISSGPGPSDQEGFFEYAKRNYVIHGFKALALDQRVGPSVDADLLPIFERSLGIRDGPE